MGKNNPLALHQRNFAGKAADGRDVYHCLRWCNRIQREFWFTLKPGGVSGESRGDMRWQFDARKLPEKYLPDASQQDLDVGRYPPGTRPIDWVMAALNDGWEPPLHPPVFDLAADLDNAIGLPQNALGEGRERCILREASSGEAATSTDGLCGNGSEVGAGGTAMKGKQ